MYILKNKNRKTRGRHKVNISPYYESMLTEVDGIVKCKHPHTASLLQKHGYELLLYDPGIISPVTEVKELKVESLPPVFVPGLVKRPEFIERNPFDSEGLENRTLQVMRTRNLDRTIENSKAEFIFATNELEPKDADYVAGLISTFSASDLIKIVFSDGAAGPSLLFKRSLWEEIGGFGGYEDRHIEAFCIRAKLRGYFYVIRRDTKPNIIGQTKALTDILDKIDFQTAPVPPLVSVIIPTFNRVNKLAEAVESVEKQAIKNPLITLEVLIIDDGSTDGTREWARGKAGAVDNVRYFRWPVNTGMPSRHVNNAVRFLARGEYVIHAFDDDVWLPNLLQDLASELLADPGLDWIHGQVKAGGNARGSNGKGRDYGGELDLDDLKAQNYIPLQGCMFRRSAFLALGGFDESVDFRCGYDWDFVIRAGAGLRQKHVNFPVAAWQPGPDGMLGKMWQSGQGSTMMATWRKKWKDVKMEVTKCSI